VESGTASEDLFLYRDAANTLALRNGANAQTFNVYGTYTSGSVYERGAVYADSNGFNIAHQQLGATKRPVRILGHNLASAEAVSALEINQTWNTTGTPTLIKANVTNTASNASSLLMDLQIGGASKLKCDTSSIVYLNGATSGSIARREDIDMLMLQNATTAYGVIGIGSVGFNYGINIRSSASLAWTIDTPASSRDLILLRDAANTLALRNAANAQAFNIYNTYTSGSVYERGFMRWVSNVLEIGTEHVGASARATAILAASGNIVLGRASGTNANADVWLGYSGAIKWSNSSTNTGASALADHCSLARVDPGILGVRGSGGAGGAISLVEMTSPAAPATNGVYIFAEDNGSGKTRLMARFATGATQQLAIEP
jgi:hypothetical protein